MKTVYLAAAAILIASSAAQAGSSIAFDFDGHKIRVTVPRNCQALSCLQVSGVDLSGLKSKLDDDAPAASTAPAASAPAAAAPVAAAPAVTAPATLAAAPVVTPPTPVAAAPVQMPAAPAPVASTALVAQPQPATPDPAPAPTTVATAPPAAQGAPAPAADPNSPLGLWATEGGKGNVVIEPCGPNICGFAEKSREKILINMKPKDSKWVGRIRDPDGGGNYDSTIVLKNSTTLRVQGCAFGGLFCGGQTWKRIS
ncbi:conserved hypothetical protein; putative exported protein [Bradyrhizobium sp. ORS 278]|uniref:DUF2147 domain-containing protein n=1 Tax=Bradyrhizobium sp. (strain ORS 278) TaxID=114615 RepID=UPI0001507F9F|nr:DUF2147 domain-containing protein [Bradyrhizobium sp. ORS 278]CAL79350.1 conserved hypothetical protein; putative exported protein [Bradyrhizobium sp. ORS 278]